MQDFALTIKPLTDRRPLRMSDLERFQRAYFRLSFNDQAAAKEWFARLSTVPTKAQKGTSHAK